MLIINDVNLPTDLAYTVSPSVRDFCMLVNICPRNKHQTTLWARVVPWVLWTPSFCQANTSQSNSSPQITNLHYVSTIIHIPVLHQNYRAIQENLYSGQNVYKKNNKGTKRQQNQTVFLFKTLYMYNIVVCYISYTRFYKLCPLKSSYKIFNSFCT